MTQYPLEDNSPEGSAHTLESLRQANENHYYAEQKNKVDLDNYVNDHSGVMRGVDGRVHTELRPDTLVMVDGVETTYEVAQAMGYSFDHDEEEIEEDDYEYEDEASHTEQQGPDHSWSLSPELQGQHTSADRIVGSEAFNAAIMGDQQQVEALASAAGVDVESATEMIAETVDAFTNHGLDYIESRIGQINDDHIIQWFNSNAVTQQQRYNALQSMRLGTYAGLEPLINDYQKMYGK
jgi:hypothetical protein